MFDWLFEKFAKRYVLKYVNKGLEDYKDNIAEVIKNVNVWQCRLDKVVKVLENVKDRIADFKLDDEEIQKTVDEIKKVVEEF